MIYVFPCSTGECSIVYDETSLTAQNKKEGIVLETLPEQNTPTGKTAILMGDKATKTVWYDYVDAVTDDTSEGDALNMYAKIENGVVTSISAMSADLAKKWGWIELPDGYGIGDCCFGGSWTKNPNPVTPPVVELKLEDVKASKLSEVSKVCEQTIFAGCDVETAQGTEHFSFKTDDQVNIPKLVDDYAKVGKDVPYHSDGNLCRFYTAAEFLVIYKTLYELKFYHTTYCNHLNVWINRCETVEEVQAITYGEVLPDDLLVHMKSILEGAANEATA